MHRKVILTCALMCAFALGLAATAMAHYYESFDASTTTELGFNPALATTTTHVGAAITEPSTLLLSATIGAGIGDGREWLYANFEKELLDFGVSLNGTGLARAWEVRGIGNEVTAFLTEQPYARPIGAILAQAVFQNTA